MADVTESKQDGETRPISVGYFGPRGSGKRTCFAQVWAAASPRSSEEPFDRDASSIHATLPSVASDEPIRLVLVREPAEHGPTEYLSHEVVRSLDALVFVAHASRAQLRQNAVALARTHVTLAMVGLELTSVPRVLQLNHADAPDAMSLSEIERVLGRWPDVISSVAPAGRGVLDALTLATKQVLIRQRRVSEPPQPVLPVEWLTERVDSQDPIALEREDLVRFGVAPAQVDRLVAGAVARGARQRWERFLSLMRPGDELWRFRNDAASWGELAGRAGYAIVRRGQPIASFVTFMS